MRVRGRPGSIVAARDDQRPAEASGVLDRVAGYEGVLRGAAERAQRGRPSPTVRAELGFDALLAEHRRAWAARWEDADVLIDGDPELQLAVRLAIFHLLASAPDEGEAAVGARGLTGRAYRGHVFWDSDVYVLPFLAATHPSAARAMLEYRVRRLPAAIRAARARDGAGARFPWESARSGQDVTPTHATRSPRRARPGAHGPARGAHRRRRRLGRRLLHRLDRRPGRSPPAPDASCSCRRARWWASRIEPDEHGRGHIRGVIGPDEYHERVDDNAFTNVMARWNLRRAADAAAGAVGRARAAPLARARRHDRRRLRPGDRNL